MFRLLGNTLQRINQYICNLVSFDLESKPDYNYIFFHAEFIFVTYSRQHHVV